MKRERERELFAKSWVLEVAMLTADNDNWVTTRETQHKIKLDTIL